jgi:hypothetical protein
MYIYLVLDAKPKFETSKQDPKDSKRNSSNNKPSDSSKGKGNDRLEDMELKFYKLKQQHKKSQVVLPKPQLLKRKVNQNQAQLMQKTIQ